MNYLTSSLDYRFLEAAFARSFEAVDGINNFVGAFASANCLSADDTFELTLAVDEIFTNFIRYNNGTRSWIEIRLTISGDTARACLSDNGVEEFDPTTVPPIDIEEAARLRIPGGRGLYLVRQMVDHIEYQYEDRVSHVTLVKTVEKHPDGC